MIFSYLIAFSWLRFITHHTKWRFTTFGCQRCCKEDLMTAPIATNDFITAWVPLHRVGLAGQNMLSSLVSTYPSDPIINFAKRIYSASRGSNSCLAGSRPLQSGCIEESPLLFQSRTHKDLAAQARELCTVIIKTTRIETLALIISTERAWGQVKHSTIFLYARVVCANLNFDR